MGRRPRAHPPRCVSVACWGAAGRLRGRRGVCLSLVGGLQGGCEADAVCVSLVGGLQGGCEADAVCVCVACWGAAGRLRGRRGVCVCRLLGGCRAAARPTRCVCVACLGGLQDGCEADAGELRRGGTRRGCDVGGLVPQEGWRSAGASNLLVGGGGPGGKVLLQRRGGGQGCTTMADNHRRRAPLTRKRHIPPHPAQPQHTNRWAPRTRKRHQREHRPQRPTERSDPTQHPKGRTGDCPGPREGTTTRRNVTRGEGTPPGSRFCSVKR